ncbi:Protein split end [Thelohanellus kitauei]|uniref:Protein split end n=1 Tax=Thelohanellus kitauei TaxID=669202 RepID=A0A0C2M3R7_THEKT|nr:Protein split end [Thelohanellus kitauei]
MPNQRIYPPRISSDLPQASDLTPDSDEEVLNVYASLSNIDDSDNDVKSSILDQVTRYRNLTVSIKKSDKSGRRFAVFTFDTPEALNYFKRAILEKRDRIIVGGHVLFFNFFNGNQDRSRGGIHLRSRDHRSPRRRSRSTGSNDRGRGIRPQRSPDQTRTLFVGNLDEKLESDDIQRHFEPFGEVIDIVVKHPPGDRSAPYAFVKYKQLSAALNARDKLQDTFIGQHRAKIGFGKASPTNVIWIGGLNEKTTEEELADEIRRYSRFVDYQFFADQSVAYFLFDNLAQSRKVYSCLHHSRLRNSGAILEIDYADPRKEAAGLVERNVQSPEHSVHANDRKERESSMSTERNDRSRKRKNPSRSSSYGPPRKSPAPIRHRQGPHTPEGKPPGRHEIEFSESSSPQPRRLARDSGSANMVERDMRNDVNRFNFGQKDSQPASFNNVTNKALVQILSYYPVVWKGGVAIKGQVTYVQLHLICGSVDPVSTMVHQATLSGKDPQMINLTGRIPLTSDRVSDIKAKIATAISTKDCCISLAQQTILDRGRDNHHSKPLSNVISYFQEKQAAGVDKIGISKMYVFAPSLFTQEQLITMMPHVTNILNASNDNYLMVMVTR